MFVKEVDGEMEEEEEEVEEVEEGAALDGWLEK